MSAVDDVERRTPRGLNPVEDAVDRTWPCCSLCDDSGLLPLGRCGGVTLCFCVHVVNIPDQAASLLLPEPTP